MRNLALSKPLQNAARPILTAPTSAPAALSLCKRSAPMGGTGIPIPTPWFLTSCSRPKRSSCRCLRSIPLRSCKCSGVSFWSVCTRRAPLRSLHGESPLLVPSRLFSLLRTTRRSRPYSAARIPGGTCRPPCATREHIGLRSPGNRCGQRTSASRHSLRSILPRNSLPHWASF